MRGLSVTLCLVLITTVTTPDAAAANPAPKPDIRAELDGRSIPPTDVANHYCHDFNYPLIQCYSTAATLAETLDSQIAIAPSGDATTLSIQAAYGTNDYVTIYSESLYAGSHAHLSQNYDGLWAIGWNDRISSFKVRNNRAGRFWYDWYATGSSYAFCCNSSIAGLGAHNNQFSSVYRSP